MAGSQHAGPEFSYPPPPSVAPQMVIGPYPAYPYAMPPTYPGAYPQMYPPLVFPKTIRGITMMKSAIGVSMVSAVIGLLLSLLWPASPTGGLSVTTVGAGCLTSILGLIWLILWVIALFRLWGGRHEFGPEHASSVGKGTVAAVLGFVIPIIGIAWLLFSAIAAAFSGGSPGVASVVLGIAGLSLLGSILLAIGQVTLVWQLLPPGGRLAGKMYFAMAFGNAALTAYAVWMLAQNGFLTVTIASQRLSLIGGIIGLVVLGLLWSVYNKAHDEALARFQASGMGGYPPAPVQAEMDRYGPMGGPIAAAGSPFPQQTWPADVQAGVVAHRPPRVKPAAPRLPPPPPPRDDLELECPECSTVTAFGKASCPKCGALFDYTGIA